MIKQLNCKYISFNYDTENELKLYNSFSELVNNFYLSKYIPYTKSYDNFGLRSYQVNNVEYIVVNLEYYYDVYLTTGGRYEHIDECIKILEKIVLKNKLDQLLTI